MIFDKWLGAGCAYHLSGHWPYSSSRELAVLTLSNSLLDDTSTPSACTSLFSWLREEAISCRMLHRWLYLMVQPAISSMPRCMTA